MNKPVDDFLNLFDLEKNIYLLRRHLGSIDKLQDHMLKLASQLGPVISTAILESKNIRSSLPVHTEGVYLKQPLPYFLLGCIQTAREGGETTVYDGRIATQIITDTHPELTQAVIEYRSLAHGLSTEHQLIEGHTTKSGESIRTLVFRENCPTNRVVHLPPNWTEKKLYKYLRSVLERSKVLSHKWRRGDILIVDNNFSLHGRTAFRGLRKMIRIRVEK